MAKKDTRPAAAAAPAPKKAGKNKVAPKAVPKKAAAKTVPGKKVVTKKAVMKAVVRRALGQSAPPGAGSATVLDRLWGVVTDRRTADPALSHSARLLSRGREKVAQKFGEEAVECLIEAVAGNRAATVSESADVLYHLLVLWVDAGIAPSEVWAELERREGVSGVAEKASRFLATTKIP